VGYDAWLLPDDGHHEAPCLTKCPVCHGTANGVHRKAGYEKDEHGEFETLWEVTGIDCQQCGHREGDECFQESEYANL